MITFDQKVQVRVAEQAGALNDGLPDNSVADSLTLLAQSGWLGYGVPESLGGAGGMLLDAVEAIAHVSEQCLTSGFVFWCQRAFIQYLVNSHNPWLQQQILPQVLTGELSGATGLSNAMKYLAGIEQLRLQARWDGEQVTLNGFLPWASNLRPDQFVVAVAAQVTPEQSLVVAIPAGANGLQRGDDLQLLGLQSAWTSTLHLNQVQVSSDWMISDNARQFLPAVRPTFLLLQCGLGLGMTRRALQETQQSLRNTVLLDRLYSHQETLVELEQTLQLLSRLPHFEVSQVGTLFELRIALTRLAIAAVNLELEAKGGNAYLKPSGTARRLREVAFLPVLTPSLVQLETELDRYRQVEQRHG